MTIHKREWGWKEDINIAENYILCFSSEAVRNMPVVFNCLQNSLVVELGLTSKQFRHTDVSNIVNYVSLQ